MSARSVIVKRPVTEEISYRKPTTHAEALARCHLLTLFSNRFWTFDSMLERTSLFSARQNAGCWVLDLILKNLISHLALEQNFKKPPLADTQKAI